MIAARLSTGKSGRPRVFASVVFNVDAKDRILESLKKMT